MRSIDDVVRAVRAGGRITFLTGAGISAESGLSLAPAGSARLAPNFKLEKDPAPMALTRTERGSSGFSEPIPPRP